MKFPISTHLLFSDKTNFYLNEEYILTILFVNQENNVTKLKTSKASINANLNHRAANYLNILWFDLVSVIFQMYSFRIFWFKQKGSLLNLV